MSKRIGNFNIYSFLSAFFSTFSSLLLLYSFQWGTDDILTNRELAAAGISAILIFGVSLYLSQRLSRKTISLIYISGLILAAGFNFEFPDLMKLPVQIPAKNMVSVTDITDGASLSMTWAYWFRPRSQTDDLLSTNPDKDISFSYLTRTGTWEESVFAEAPCLTARENGAAVGIPAKFRMQLAVLCMYAEGGAVSVSIPGKTEPFIVTPEMTSSQPVRIVLNNGLLPEPAGNLIQILLWSGSFSFLALCGTAICSAAMKFPCKHKNIIICSASALFPCLIMILLCVTLGITPFGEKSFLINDMWGEYADYMAYFRTILSGENDLFYSFSKSIGDDLPSLIAFYVINPLNWLVCLFKPEDLPLAVTILVILRYGIAGLTASIYFVKRRNCSFSAVLFSACYALMSFSIVNAENTNLRESAMVLPLVIMGLEQLIEGKSFRTYVWSLAAAIFLNFYSGYQICVFSVIYFLFFYFGKERESSFIKTFWRFICSSLAAVGICAFLLIPIVLQLRNGPKSVDSDILNVHLNMPWRDLFGKLLVSSYDVDQFKFGGLPNLYISLFCAVLLPLYFLNREIPAKKRALTAGMLVSFILIMQINPLNLALHGFNEPRWWPYRYSFIICFIMLIISQESFALRGAWHIWEICLSAACFAVLIWFLSTANYGWMSGNSLILNSIFLTGIFLLACFGLQRGNVHAAAILSIITAFELFLNASHILTINTAYERSNTVSDYVSYYTSNQPVFDELKKMDDGFYRAEKNHFRTANDSMLFNYNGIAHYSSTLNKDVMRFLPSVGFRYYPYRFLYWEGSDVSMDSFLGIKYLVSAGKVNKPYSPVFEKNSYTVYNNPYALPIMFTASPAVMSADLSSQKGGFELQNQIFSALTGEKTEIFRPAKYTEPVSEGLIFQAGDTDKCWFSEEGEEETTNGYLTWHITAENSDTLYAFFPSEDIHPAALKLNDKSFGRYFDNYSYHILRLGSFEKDENIKLEMSPMEDRICLNDAQFYHEDINALGKAVTALEEDKTELRKLTSSHLKGSFTASDDKVLFFSIPYDKGWTIKIDGEKVPVNKVLGTFMAVSVSPGMHTVELRYLPVGLIPGVVVSILSVLAIVFLGRKKSRLE